MLTIERSLNIYAAGIPQIISLSQYDDDFQLVFTLYTSEGEFTIPSGTTAEVMGTKVDGNGYSASASISGSTVTVTGNKQMTACAGRNVYEIVLTKSGKRLATVNFILKVERAALDADTIQSETVLKELNAIIDSAETATEAATQAAASAAAAAESARTLTIDPTLTQSGQAADAKAVGNMIGKQEEVLNWNKKHLIILNVDPVDLTPVSNDGIDCIVINCTAGEKIAITADGGNQSRAWAFLDSSNHVLSVADANTHVEGLELTAPTNAVKLVVNNRSGLGFDGHVYKIVNRIASLENEVADIKTDLAQVEEKIQDISGLSDDAKVALLACFRNVVWLDDQQGQSYYEDLENALSDGEVGIPLGTVTQFTIGTSYFDRNNGFTTSVNNKRATCDISSINFNVGDMIKLSSTIKDTYQFLIGAASANSTPNNRSWIRDGYSSEDLVLQGSDVVDAKVILIRRSDDANMTDADLEVLGQNILWKRSSTNIYNMHRIEYPNSYMGKINGSLDIDVNSAKYGLKITEMTTRRNICFNYGKFPYYNNATNFPLISNYPIPVPDDAVNVKISITPATQYMFVWQYHWNADQNIYQQHGNTGWTQGECTMSLADYTDRFITINTKYDSAGSAYPTEPSKIVIEFS